MVFILCSGFLKAKPKSLANKGLSDAQRAAAQVFACARRTWCACGVLFREWISAGWNLRLDTRGTGIGGVSHDRRSLCQGVDSEAAWEAAQKAAAQNTAVSVDFNPYDAETGMLVHLCA